MATDPAFRPLESHAIQRQLLDKHYEKLKNARANGIKTVYVPGNAPTDIAVAMGFLPIFPENHATMCAAAKVGTYHCQVAEDHHYSPDLCSYSKNDFGSFMAGPDTKSPIGGLPKPDLLMATTVCNSHVKWFEDLSRIWNIPLLLLDVPYVRDGVTTEEKAARDRYTYRQLKEQWIPFFESYCGRPYDYAKLEEVVSNTRKAARLWWKVIESTRNVPSPITIFDVFMLLGTAVSYRGFPEAAEFYEKLNAEIAERVAAGFSAIGEEKYRLYFDNIPMWFKLGYFAKKFAAHKACVVSAVYPISFTDVFGDQDPNNPLESIGRAQYWSLFTNRGTQYRIDLLKKVVEDYRVDGLIMQMSRTCKLFVPDQLVIMKEVQKLTGVPGIVIEGDMVDDRVFSEEKVEAALETFFEGMASIKR